MKRLLRSIPFSIAIAMVFMFSFSLAQEPNYDAVAEWNGPHYHVANGSGQYGQGKVDDPVIDSPFENPNSIAVWNDGTNYITFVVDSYNDRIQFFETDISAVSELLDYDAAPGFGEFGGDDIYFTNGGVIPGSEVIIIDGIIYTRVADETIYAAGDEVYSIVYTGAAGVGGHASLPVGTGLTLANVVQVKYAFSSVPASAGVGDIDYSIADASPAGGAAPSAPFGITETVPNTASHPSTFENITSIAINTNTAGADIQDVYVLDAGDASELFFTYRAASDATTFEWVSTYEGPLANPRDIDVEESASDNTLAVPVVTNWGGTVTQAPAAAPTVTILNNALWTNHDYTIDVIDWLPGAPDEDMLGSTLLVTDNTTNNVISYYTVPFTTSPAGAYNFDDLIPGARVVITTDALMDFTNGGDGATIETTGGTAAEINDFIFIVDTGNDRIKIIKGADNGDAATNGAGTDYFAGDSRTDYYWIATASIPHKTFTAACRAEEGSFTLYTGDNLGLGRTEWTEVNDFSVSGPSDYHYMYDYETGVITLGDGNFGSMVAVGDTVLAVYNESIDVIDYGSTGAGTGKFNSPSGICARYNESQGYYDVYVSDTGNNRVVKLKFYPGNSVNPASVNWVTSWTAGSSTADVLSGPTDLTAAIDGDDHVYLFVCDTGNNRVVVYRDTEAEPTGEGGTTQPYYSSVIGSEGTDLGYFTSPVGVSVYENGDDLDVYVVDSERGYVEKFEEGLSPYIDVDYSNLDPAGYPPNSSYTFRKDASIAGFGVNAPAGAYILFYYSDSLNANVPILCSNDHVSPDSTEFSWLFSSTPSGTPDDGTYYLYAKLFNASGALLAQDNSTGNEELIINSSLVQGLTIFDPFDNDEYLYMQNSSEKIIHFSIDYPDSIVAVNFTGTFDPDLLQFLSISLGSAWDNLQHNAIVFTSDYDNTAGSFSINTSVLGSGYGLFEAGSYVVATAKVKAKSNAITTTSRFENSTLEISSGSMTDYNGIPISAPALNELELRFGYLADVATPGVAYGDLPHMVPTPDGIIGFDDLVVFTLGWNGIGGVQDPIADLGPVTGSLPNLAANPDGDWDVYDLLAFTEMFSWYSAQTFTTSFSTGLVMAAGTPGAVAADAVRSAEGLELNISANSVTNLMSSKITVSYDPERFIYNGADEGNFLNANASTFFIANESAGTVVIYISRLNGNNPSVSGSGSLVTLNFTPADDQPASFTVGYDLAGSNGRIIDSGSFPFNGNGVPDTYGLSQNHPNPFNPSTAIAFQLAHSGKVRLEVYNIMGEKVATLVDSYMNAGYHSIEWNTLNETPVSSGVYFYALTAGDFHSVKKMILMK